MDYYVVGYNRRYLCLTISKTTTTTTTPLQYHQQQEEIEK